MKAHLMLLAMLCPVMALAAGPQTPATWTSYVGAQDGLPVWAGFQRGAGKALRDSDRSGDGAALKQALQQVPGRHDIVVPVGSVGSGKRGERAEASQNTKPSFANLDDQHRLYWQIGNEINSRFMQQALLGGERSDPAKASRRGGRGAREASRSFDDLAVIPVYAEQVFAPTVSAIEQARPRPLPAIVLGTIANSFRPSSIDWLDQLLAYRFASGSPMAGSRVADHVAVIAIHYAASADDPRWESIFDRLDREWRVPGIVHGIWATEELGKRRAEAGEGAATAVRVSLSYLDRVARLQLAPEALRWSFYAWRRGPEKTTGDDGMRLLASVLGSARAEDRKSEVTIDGDAGLELQAFSPADARQRLVVAVFNRSDRIASLRSLRLPAGLSDDTSALMLDSQGQHVIATTRDGTGLKFAQTLMLARGQTLLLRYGAGALPAASPGEDATTDTLPEQDVDAPS